VLNEEAKSVTSFAVTENLKKILAIPHEYPDKNEYKSKSLPTVNFGAVLVRNHTCIFKILLFSINWSILKHLPSLITPEK
jgi:hypothetical protein